MRSAGKSFGNELEKRVLAYLRQYCGIDVGSDVIVAVSGGADSLCLLHVLHRLSEHFPLNLHVAHMDHMLRGRASGEDAEFVAQQARALRLPCTVESRDILEYKLEHRCSLEEAAREVRYEFLRAVAESCGAETVITGHTRDDDVETVMLHILRGSGIHGLRGLEPATEVPFTLPVSARRRTLRLARPLLTVSREETVTYCSLRGLTYRRDVSNEYPHFLRNRIRLEVLPALRQINPRLDDTLLRLASAAAEDDGFIVEAAQITWDNAVTSTQTAVFIDLPAFQFSAPAVQARLLRQAVVHLTGSARDLSHAHVTLVRELAAGTEPRQMDLPLNVIVRRARDCMVAFIRGHDPACDVSRTPLLPVSLDVPGETRIPGWRVVTTYEKAGSDFITDPYVARLDAAKTGPHLTVRRRRPGDRFRPLGMVGQKKLQDFMVDAKIPIHIRDCVPVVCSGDDIVWVVGWRIDDRVKLAACTQDVVRIEFLPVPEDNVS